DVDAGRETGARPAIGRAVRLDAHVAAAHTDHARFRAVALDQRVAPGKAGEDLDAERLGVRGQLLAQLAERDDEVARIVHLRRRRQAEGARLRVEPELIAPGGHADVRRVVASRGHELVERRWLHHAARQDVRADL